MRISDWSSDVCSSDLDVLQRVAGRAHLAIDLQTALQSMAVVGAEGAGEAPVHMRQRRALAGRGGRARSGQRSGRGKGRQAKQQSLAHPAFSIGLAVAPTGAPPPLRTGSPIEVGRGRGRSNTPSSGRTPRKCRKYQKVATRRSEEHTSELQSLNGN